MKRGLGGEGRGGFVDCFATADRRFIPSPGTGEQRPARYVCGISTILSSRQPTGYILFEAPFALSMLLSLGVEQRF